MKWYFFTLLWCHAYGQRQAYLQRTDGKANSRLTLKERTADIERVAVTLTDMFEVWRGKPREEVFVYPVVGEWVIWRISDKAFTVSVEKPTLQFFVYSHFHREAIWYLYKEKEKLKTFKTKMATSDIRFRPWSRDLFWMGEEKIYRVSNIGNYRNISTHSMQVKGSIRQIRFAFRVTIVMTDVGIFKMEGQFKPEQITKLPFRSGQLLVVDTSSTPTMIWWIERTVSWVIGRMDISGQKKFRKTINEFQTITAFTAGMHEKKRYIFVCADKRLVSLRLSPHSTTNKVLPTDVSCEDVTVEGDNIFLFVRGKNSCTLDTYDLKSGKLVHSVNIRRADIKSESKMTIQLFYW